MEKKYTAEGGVSVYTYKNPALHGFYISLFLRGGSMYEGDDERGITHFLEHALVRNVNKRHGYKLYSELDRYGMEFNASTYSEMVQFYVSGAEKNFARGADIISEILTPIILDRSEIDTERRRIKAEIREGDDRTSLSTFSMQTVFSGTSLSGTITGTAAGVDKFTLRRLEEYRQRAFISENVFFYITGNFSDADVDYLLSLISKRGIRRADSQKEIHTNMAPVPHNFLKRGAEIAIKNADYTTVRFTFDIDMKSVPSQAVDLIYDILLAGYNSPFFIEMSEERGLFYDISGATERYRNIGILHFTYEVKEKNLYDAVEMSVKILKDFKSKLLDREECMKAGYVDNAHLLYDDSREFNFTFAYDGHIMELGYGSIEDRINSYKNITPEAIRRCACEIFRTDALTLTLKGNKKKIDCERLKIILKELDF